MLGLPRRPGLSNDDVRAAWRRIAAATHPDRDDGGDPVAFGAAAAAYAMLRTAYGRGEALADLAGGPGAGRGGARGRHARSWLRAGDRLRGWDWLRPRGRHGAHRRHGTRGGIRVLGRDSAREVRGRPGVLALRAGAAAAVCGVAFAVAGLAPATIGLLAGSLAWLVYTGRHDLP